MDGTDINALLELGGNLEVLQQRHGLFGDLVGTQRFCLFHQTVDHCELTHSN